MKPDMTAEEQLAALRQKQRQRSINWQKRAAASRAEKKARRAALDQERYAAAMAASQKRGTPSAEVEQIIERVVTHTGRPPNTRRRDDMTPRTFEEMTADEQELVRKLERHMGEKATPEEAEAWLEHVKACGGYENTALGED